MAMNARAHRGAQSGGNSRPGRADRIPASTPAQTKAALEQPGLDPARQTPILSCDGCRSREIGVDGESHAIDDAVCGRRDDKAGARLTLHQSSVAVRSKLRLAYVSDRQTQPDD